MDESLSQFVRDAIAKGISREEIEKTLLSAGWSRDEIQGALTLFADIDFPIPVPRPKPYMSAREAFIYLVMFTMLYLSAWSLGSVLFDFINRAFPDPTQSSLVATSISAGCVGRSPRFWSRFRVICSYRTAPTSQHAEIQRDENQRSASG